MALLGFVMGMAWTGPVGMLVGAVLCELIMIAGSGEVVDRGGFAVLVVCWWFGQISLILFASESYVQMVIDMGMTAEYGQGLIDWVHSPVFPVCGCVTAVCALLGSWLACASSRSTSRGSRPKGEQWHHWRKQRRARATPSRSC